MATLAGRRTVADYRWLNNNKATMVVRDDQKGPTSSSPGSTNKIIPLSRCQLTVVCRRVCSLDFKECSS